jgi:transketolase
MFRLGFQPESLSEDHVAALEALRRQCTGDILTMTTLATCGHPGGSMSTLPALLMLYANAKVSAEAPLADDRDRIFISHGHVSPGTYAALSAYGYCDRRESIVTFRRFGSHFGGHVEMGVPGVEWNTGNLGQGLSAAVGSALGARLSVADPSKDLREQIGSAYKVACIMGDGEQQKGQLSEARRLAVKYGCNNVVGIVDWNRLQIGGALDEIMPQDIAAGWAADGWNVLEVDGHNWAELYSAFRDAWNNNTKQPERPTVIMMRTLMGHGVDFMEDLAKWHGQALKPDQLADALEQLGQPNELASYQAERDAMPEVALHHPFPTNPPPTLNKGEPIVYPAGTVTDCRSAYGAVMTQLADRNNGDGVKIAAFSADLKGSVKLGGFHSSSPAAFIEGGIQEHNSATASGRLSREGYSVFFSTFGIFGVTEVFNQQRLNGFNKANLKLVCTHCGTDVGEDGPTHQVVDYAGLLRSTFDWDVFVPADANQCDRIVRAVADQPGCQFVGMGRSKMGVIHNVAGDAPYYDGTVGFTPGKADVLREGDDGAILAVGMAVGHAVAAHDQIFEQTGKRVRVVNMASLRPVDRDAVVSAAGTGFILTVEDHHPDTGLGGVVALTLADEGIACRLRRAGIDQWPGSGKPADIHRFYKIDAAGIAGRVIAALG